MIEDRELATAIAAIYASPLEAFIAHRDALTKALRAEGKRDFAATIKALRKPSRLAWVLNLAVHSDRGATDALVARVTAVLDSQTSGAGVRGSIDALRAAVRGFAELAARAAAEHGHIADHADVVQAVLAVIGDSSAFDALRGARLVDVPEPGGLDFLSWRPSTGGTPSSPAEPSRAGESVKVATAALEKAEAALAKAREAATAAERAFRAAEADVERAEEEVRHAEEHARERRAERDHARHVSLETARTVLEAERVLADAQARQRSPGG